MKATIMVDSEEDFDSSPSEDFGSPLDDEGDISICEKHKDILIQNELLFKDGVGIPQGCTGRLETLIFNFSVVVLY
jgi:hypothetical protein